MKSTNNQTDLAAMFANRKIPFRAGTNWLETDTRNNFRVRFVFGKDGELTDIMSFQGRTLFQSEVPTVSEVIEDGNRHG